MVRGGGRGEEEERGSGGDRVRRGGEMDGKRGREGGGERE